MNTVPLERATVALTKFVKKRNPQPLVLTQQGKPVAFVFPCADETDFEHFSWTMSPKLREIIEQSSEEIRQGKGIPHDEFWPQLDEKYADQNSQAAMKKHGTRKPKTRRTRTKAAS